MRRVRASVCISSCIMQMDHLHGCLVPVLFCDDSIRCWYFLCLVSLHRASVYVQVRWLIESIHGGLVLPLAAAAAAAASASALRLADDDSDTGIDDFARVVYEAK